MKNSNILVSIVFVFLRFLFNLLVSVITIPLKIGMERNYYHTRRLSGSYQRFKFPFNILFGYRRSKNYSYRPKRGWW